MYGRRLIPGSAQVRPEMPKAFQELAPFADKPQFVSTLVISKEIMEKGRPPEETAEEFALSENTARRWRGNTARIRRTRSPVTEASALSSVADAPS